VIILFYRSGKEAEFDAFESRQSEFGIHSADCSPVGARQVISLSRAMRPTMFWKTASLNAGEGYALCLARDSAIALRGISVDWTIAGEKRQLANDAALYVVRFGKNITSDNFYKWFDVLIARNLQ